MMTTLSPRRTALACLYLATAMLVSMNPCRGADSTFAPAVQEAIAAVRDSRAGLYDVFDSSTLGTTASPAEYAATQRNLRQYYLTPAEPLEFSAARQAELATMYGRVTLVGVPRAAKAYALGITGASVIDADGRPELTVTGIEPKSPADGKLKVGDVIIGSNNRLFPDWEDPRVPIGYAVAAAQTEAFGGMLTLYVGRDGKMITVQIKLPVDGGYGENWPYDCKKSKADLPPLRRKRCQPPNLGNLTPATCPTYRDLVAGTFSAFSTASTTRPAPHGSPPRPAPGLRHNGGAGVLRRDDQGLLQPQRLLPVHSRRTPPSRPGDARPARQTVGRRRGKVKLLRWPQSRSEWPGERTGRTVP